MAALPTGVNKSLSAKYLYEPLPRYTHVSQSVGNKVLVQGGRTKDFSEKGKQLLSSVVEIFNPYSYIWEQKEVKGEAPPPGTLGSASASANNELFTFGGFDGRNRFNMVHKLDTKTWQWNQLSSQNAEGAPMPKAVCGTVLFRDNLAVFGGYGQSCGPTVPGSFMKTAKDSPIRTGWTNEFHVYNLNKGIWNCPATTGEIPPPCALFTFTGIDERRAVLFGGFNEKQRHMNHVYIIDFHSMHWTQLKKSGKGPWPEERARHAACCLNYGKDYPQILLTGGRDRHDKPLTDAWILDVDRKKWRKVTTTLKPRCGHSLTASNLDPGMTEVTMFGGTAESWAGGHEKQPKLADTTLLQFKCSDYEWELDSVVKNTERGSLERIVEKLDYMVKCKLPATEEIALLAKVRNDELQLRLEEAVEERDKMRVEKQKVEDERDRLMVEIQEMERERDRARVENHCAQERASELQQRLVIVQHEKDELMEKFQQAQARLNELRSRLHEVELREHERLAVQEQATAAEQRGPSWKVNEEDLESTEKVLGTGGWAEVRIAHLKVAAKYLHSGLVYDYHRQHFRREMAIAARVCHPNLLRFHGAKMDGGMAILTELMPTSLRALINSDHERHLPLEHILSIALDVACALNYLHHMTPDPIIHRDLSSANVLLQPTPDGGWLAKVSDYGSANFQRLLRTENPGSPVYAAPEACDPDRQSSKMDIYSFGVLLVEMCTCELPVPESRDDLLRAIEHRQLLDLIQQCLNSKKELHPTAAQIADILQSMR